MSKYTLIIKKDARKYRTPLFETNNNTIGLEMQQKEVKICGGVGRGSGGCLLHRKKFATHGRFRYDKRTAVDLPGNSHTSAASFLGCDR